jgi:hypothetical protein
MKTNVNHSFDQPWPHPAATHYLDKQRLCILRILRCTAKAMASGPGGLRFKAGTRPWLDGARGRPACLVYWLGPKRQPVFTGR